MALKSFWRHFLERSLPEFDYIHLVPSATNVLLMGYQLIQNLSITAEQYLSMRRGRYRSCIWSCLCVVIWADVSLVGLLF